MRTPKKSEGKEEKKRPVISFSKVENKVNVLENRPVMALPPGERSYRSSPRREAAPTSAVPPSGERRLRDDSKPMFQRNIGFATPMKDGTAKKGVNGKK